MEYKIYFVYSQSYFVYKSYTAVRVDEKRENNYLRTGEKEKRIRETVTQIGMNKFSSYCVLDSFLL